MGKDEIRLTGIILAKNEEERIKACIECLSFCDELILVDNGSTDKTCLFAKQYNIRILKNTSVDFSVLRNSALSVSYGKWILYVDADEIVPSDLRQEIQRITQKEVQSSGPKAYYISRINYYLGTKWPVQDTMQRLFLRDALIEWNGILHETASVRGSQGYLTNPLIHHTHRTLEEMVIKTNAWSTYEATLRYNAQHPPIVWWRLFRVMWTGFSKSFFWEGGYRAGSVGWIESIYQGFSMFLTYAKLWELQQKSSKL